MGESIWVKRPGGADLPLHGGRVPPWLANRMTELGTAIAEHTEPFSPPRKAHNRHGEASLVGRARFH